MQRRSNVTVFLTIGTDSDHDLELWLGKPWFPVFSELKHWGAGLGKAGEVMGGSSEGRRDQSQMPLISGLGE